MRTLLVTIALMLGTSSLSAAPPAAPETGLPSPPGLVRRFGSDRFRFPGLLLGSATSPDGTRLAVLSLSRLRERLLFSVLHADTGQPICRESVDASGLFAPSPYLNLLAGGRKMVPPSRVFASPLISFSPDGKYVAAAVCIDFLAVWDARTGRLVMKVPLASPFCQFTPDGLLAVTRRDRTDLYAVPSGKVARTWPVGRIARLTRDARIFVQVDNESNSINLGETATGAVCGKLAAKVADSRSDNGLVFSADGTKLAVIDHRQRIQLWDTATRKKLCEAEVPSGAIWVRFGGAVSFSPDGRTVALQTDGGEIERWEVRSLDHLPILEAPTLHVRGVDWSKDGRTILTAASNGLVHRWDVKTGTRLADDGYHNTVCFSLTPDGAQLVVGDRLGRIDVWDVATGRIVRRLDRGSDGARPLVRLAISPDGRRVVAGEGHIDIRVFPIDGGEPSPRVSCQLRLDGGWMNFLAWAPDGSSVFADGSGMILCRVNLPGGKIVWTEGDEDIHAHALTPDGKFVVREQRDRIQLLDSATGKVCTTFRVEVPPEAARDSWPLRALAISGDGKQLATSVGKNTIAICDISGRERARFAAAQRKKMAATAASDSCRVEALAFTPDGKWLVSGADDGEVQVLEAATGREIVRFDGHDSTVAQVAVAPDGRSVFSAGGDGHVCQWDLTPGAYAGKRQALGDLWAAAMEADAAVAVQAAWALVTRSDATREFVAAKLPPFAAPKKEEVARWLADLDSPQFADREAASTALAALGRIVERRLRDTAGSTTSAEVRRRIRDLLARLDAPPAAEVLRVLRLVQACELSGTPPARALLRRWGGGAPGALLTEDARAALARLDRQHRRPTLPHERP
jgi:WD40 repeat protein